VLIIDVYSITMSKLLQTTIIHCSCQGILKKSKHRVQKMFQDSLGTI